MIRKNPEPPELDYAENPALANWPSLERNRAVFTGDVAEEIEYKPIQLGPTGFSGGPRVRILGDFRYRTAEGKRRPFRGTTLFTWTFKMSCPSFSLPAGPVEHGGTCPASRRQSIEREGTYTAHHEPLESAPAGSKFICDVCLTGETLIPVRGRGLIRFDQVVSEFLDKEARLEVLADTGWVGVTNAWRKGPRKVIRINSTCGMKLRLTSDHKVLTTDGWVKASDLEPGDRLEVAPKYKAVSGRWPSQAPIQKIEVPFAEMARGEAAPDYPVQWSREVGLVLGYILGDGTVGNGLYPTVCIAFTSKDRADLEDICGIVNSWCGSTSEVIEIEGRDARLKTGVEVKATSPQVRVAWRRLSLSRFFNVLGLDKTPSPEFRRVPKSVWTATEEGVAGFISGLFSTDGSVVENGDGKVALVLASVSHGLLEDVQNLLSNFGVRSTICPYSASNRSRLEAGYLQLYKLEVGAKDSVLTFREKIGFHSRRKAALLKEANLDYRKPWSSRRYAVVESVFEEPKEDEVYDIEVDHENHRFVANGIVVSNCYAGKGRYLMYKSMSLGQVAKLRWVQRTLRSGTFVRRMSEAVGSLFDRRVEETLARKLVSNRFFRIHDSGDFFSPEYYRAWVEVAWNFTGKGGQTGHPLVYFWAPTRMWVYQKWRTLFENYPPPPNLALRPSALFTSARPPSIGGLAEGSTSIDGRMPASVWNCPAYEGNEEHSCAAARCRVCWTRKSKPVNYLTH